MPFIPHTRNDEKTMLETLGVDSIEELFDEIPSQIRSGELSQIPAGISEMELIREMNSRASLDEIDLCFIGAGAYQHHIPGAVWDLVSRGEFLTAYTPYQAEASQGTLQLIYEFQSMMTHLTVMDVSNASVYDGASALAEAALMAVRANRKSKSRKILFAGTGNPYYRKAMASIVHNQNIVLEDLAFSSETGTIERDALSQWDDTDITALVITNPNFFGGLEQVDELTEWAHNKGTLVIAVVNPLSLAMLKPPGLWGDTGADIAVGDGQPLGIPMASGGPYFGFMCCKQNVVRQMPGRIIGKTVDLDGREGFTLTLQAREQHIRRAKATSNICTNQGLLVSAATIYMSMLGADGMHAVARQCHTGMQSLIRKLSVVQGAEPLFSGPVFHELVIKLSKPADEVLAIMADSKILGGLELSPFFDDMSDCILVNVTETKTNEDLDAFIAALEQALNQVMK
jgi:glycine dehydrogenase subunit 1